MKTAFGKFFSFMFSAVDAATETASTGSSILISRKSAKFTKTDYGIAYSLGLLTGVIDFITSYCFQGAVIRERFKDQEDVDDAALELFVNGKVSNQRKGAYLALKYSYIISDIIFNYRNMILLYSASKAWFQDLKNGEDTPLTFISNTENFLIFLYYVSLDLPLIITAEIWQTLKEMENLFGIPEGHAPDKKLMDLLAKLAKPIAQNQFCRKFIRISGSLADTVEHVFPLALIIPTSWILDVAQSNPLLAWGSLSAALVFLIIISGTVLAQTYLFEGKFSEENLKSIANSCDHNTNNDSPWISRKISKILNKLLYMGGPLHGVDTSLSILLTLRELKTPEAVANFFAVLFFFISCMGNHYSEVKESQESLAKITLDTTEQAKEKIRMLSYQSKSLFFQTSNYGATQNSLYKKAIDFVHINRYT